MTSADRWREWARAIRTGSPTQRDQSARELYSDARRLAPQILSGTERSAQEGLVHDVLGTKWETMLDADSPKAFFATALRNRGIDRHRRRDRRGETSLDELREKGVDPGEAPRTEATLESRRTLARVAAALSPRDFRIVYARASGASSREIAETEGLSTANVDQIVSRARKRLEGLR